MANGWICPFCNWAQPQTAEQYQSRTIAIEFGESAIANPRWHLEARGCVNPDCRQMSASAMIIREDWLQSGAGRRRGNVSMAFTRMLPRGASKPQPSYIPEALRDDYSEACAIRDLSPKAAATLVRRCLQGMIRDFCGIDDKRTLYAEIEALRKIIDEGRAPSGVTAESVEAIDQVRGIGNIGAHMEHDINLIVDVDPDEAQMLIELVEMLFAEWYVARHAREEKLAKIKEISAAKQEARSPKPDEGAA